MRKYMYMRKREEEERAEMKEGDTKFCEKNDALKQYLQRKLDNFEKKGE
jgi:hypothetical protein